MTADSVVNDNNPDSDADGLREVIIRYDPENAASSVALEWIRRVEEADTENETQAIPERRTFSVADEERFDRIAEAALGVASAFCGSSLHAGDDFVAYPECHYDGRVDEAVFPGGSDH